MKENIKKGKRHGKGKKYYYGGKLEFEGVYLNGERNGVEKDIIKTVILILK